MRFLHSDGFHDAAHGRQRQVAANDRLVVTVLIFILSVINIVDITAIQPHTHLGATDTKRDCTQFLATAPRLLGHSLAQPVHGVRVL